MIPADYLSKLNDAQREAVEYLGGPQLVIAGAGSGKTRVLTYKVLHLLALGYAPRRIMALTFTNKAADEMRSRIEALAGTDTARKLRMGTFHSVFARILRMNAEALGYGSNYTIYDSSDSKALVRSIIREMNLDEKTYKPSTVAGIISDAKNNLYSPEDYLGDAAFARRDNAAGRPLTGEIYRRYRDRCRISNAMDFDDLIFYPNVLFRDHPAILEQYSSYFEYVLVDEYQDTNFAQHMLVRQMCAKKGNLCAVGDDAQSIYSFRGADIGNILKMETWFPGLKIFKLEQNYRSTRYILDAANSLIACNKDQIRKEIFSENGDGRLIEVASGANDYEEAYILANSISQVHMRTGDPYREIAVLYRTNAQSRILEEALRNRNIPYRIYGGLAFYQRKEIKDATSYFRLAVNLSDDEAFRRIINFPLRGIGETTVRKVSARASEAGVSMYAVASEPERHGLDVSRKTAEKLKGFAAMMEGFARRHREGDDAATLARHIISTVGLLQMYVSDTAPESISKRENMLELIKAADEFTETRREQGDPDISMADFMANTSLLTDQDMDDPEGERDCITLMTIHAAKGLEFSDVFIVGAEEELLPSAMCRTEREVEEERRLMYVAITRAKRFCRISFAGRRVTNGQPRTCSPSRFLLEIKPEYLKLVAGTRLRGAQGTPPPAPRTFEQPRRVSREVFGGHFDKDESPAPQTVPAASAQAADFATHRADELSAGMKIEHKVFGRGRIISVERSGGLDGEPFITACFDKERKLLLKFAKFRIL